MSEQMKTPKNPHDFLAEEARKETRSYDPTYKQGLLDLLAAKSNKSFKNSSPLHAAIVYETFFELAEKSVRIFCQDLNPAVFEQAFVVKAAKDAIDRKVKISVVTEQSPKAEGFLQMLTQAKREGKDIEIRKLGLDVTYNFSVLDSTGYRFERQHQDVSAIGRMYDPDGARTLCQHFDEKLLPLAEDVVESA